MYHRYSSFSLFRVGSQVETQVTTSISGKRYVKLFGHREGRTLDRGWTASALVAD